MTLSPCHTLLLLSYAIALLCQSSQPLPLTLYSFLNSSHISFQIWLNFYTTKSLAVLIAINHDPPPRCYRGYTEQQANQLHGSRTKNRVLLSIKGRGSVYKKESVRWPESEGAGKVKRYQWWLVRRVKFKCYQFWIQKYYNVYEDRIDLEKMCT